MTCHLGQRKRTLRPGQPGLQPVRGHLAEPDVLVRPRLEPDHHTGLLVEHVTRAQRITGGRLEAGDPVRPRVPGPRGERGDSVTIRCELDGPAIAQHDPVRVAEGHPGRHGGGGGPADRQPRQPEPALDQGGLAGAERRDQHHPGLRLAGPPPQLLQLVRETGGRSAVEAARDAGGLGEHRVEAGQRHCPARSNVVRRAARSARSSCTSASRALTSAAARSSGPRASPTDCRSPAHTSSTASANWASICRA